MGLHRSTEALPYTPSIALFAIRSPDAVRHRRTLANLDAGTIAEWPTSRRRPQDGSHRAGPVRALIAERPVSSWIGAATRTCRTGSVTRSYVYVRNADGFEELITDDRYS
jgi:hypothetical protein